VTTSNTLRAEDVLPVRSRVSWGAVFAGAAVAMAVYFLLAAFGTALGLSLAHRVTEQELGASAVLWAIASLLIALFVGGYTAAQCAVGENRGEAVIHGLILWGVLFAALLWLASTGLSFGFNALIGVVSNPAGRALDTEALRAGGITQEQIDRLRGRLQNYPGELRQAGENPTVTRAAWWLLGGTVLSMLAAVGGALAGSGPPVVFRPVFTRRIRTENVAPRGALPR
jgi:hypothetical protein